jgi:hypothetical protein
MYTPPNDHETFTHKCNVRAHSIDLAPGQKNIELTNQVAQVLKLLLPHTLPATACWACPTVRRWNSEGRPNVTWMVRVFATRDSTHRYSFMVVRPFCARARKRLYSGRLALTMPRTCNKSKIIRLVNSIHTTHACVHTHAHARTRTHTHAHAHTHTLCYVPFYVLCSG